MQLRIWGKPAIINMLNNTNILYVFNPTLLTSVFTAEQGRLKITRGPWATALRQAPLPQKDTFFFSFFFFKASWQLFMSNLDFFFLVNMPVNIHNIVLRKMWI